MLYGIPPYRRRKTLKLAGYDYAHAGAYYVTICTFIRDEIFGEVMDGEMILSPAGQIAEKEWLAIFGKPIPGSLWTIVGGFKSGVTRELHKASGNERRHIWQSRYYDHIVGDERYLQRIRRYIRNNPIRWHLDREREWEEIHQGDLWRIDATAGHGEP